MAIREFLERTALFSQVDAGVAQRLSELASTHTYPRGTALWRVGDFPHSLVFVKSGLVKLTRPAPKGRTALCGLFGAPTSIGELVMAKDRLRELSSDFADRSRRSSSSSALETIIGASS
jgi:CRP-like cAMP-binding protein